MKPDEEIRVVVLPREYGYALTPEGEAALHAEGTTPAVVRVRRVCARK